MIPNPLNHEQVRTDLLDYMRKELVGPQSDDEILDGDNVPQIDHYIAGVLYPQSKTDSEDDRLATQPDISEEDADIADDLETKVYGLSNIYMPASMGISCQLAIPAKEGVQYKVTCARYELQKTEIKNASGRSTHWVRIPIKKEGSITLQELAKGKVTIEIEKGLELVCIFKPDKGYLTVSLVNENEYDVSVEEKVKPRKLTPNCFFQSELVLTGAGDDHFLPRKPYECPDGKERTYEMLFRNKPTFAIGHGCAADWDKSRSNRTNSVKTTTFPVESVPSVDFEVIQDKKILQVLDMKRLSESLHQKEEILSDLRQFAKEYDLWIDRIETSDVDPVFYDVAKENIIKCRMSFERIEAGIQKLEDDPEVFEAFVLMNKAMVLQRLGHDPKEPSTCRWRPFQLAFILLSVVGLIDDQSSDRNIVDLIWFPTGGGKTEAYLGITAFIIFYRRIKYKALGGGTAAIMRYTLRLLTTQQLQRATRLMCACEIIRKQNSIRYGSEVISSGIWVGGDTTPNTSSVYREQLEDGEFVKILSMCPWCESALQYSKRTNPKIYCKNENCKFSKGLPILFVDDDIYENPPTFLVSTVDKFANLSLKADPKNKKKDAARIFAADAGNQKIAPSLIIQDELHLISGALGTLVGLFEIVIEELCSLKKIKPKIVAATATIRGAEEQTKNLFNREVFQFPSPGISIEDSFFAVEKTSKENRLYVGVQASGHTFTTTEVRVFSALLQGIYEIKSAYEEGKTPEEMAAVQELIDPYWTMIAYFNSVRQLGKCHSLLDQDIATQMVELSKRSGSRRRFIPDRGIREMTGTRKTKDIAEILAELFYPLNSKKALDIVLTTNMFSVGVDISRLGAMVITSHPKTNAEYIQASSRVGRKYPGIIFTVYDFSRSRDRSYYENFVGYHRALYRHVEVSSLTPFSMASVDRGMKSVIISLLRQRFRSMGVDDLNTLSADKRDKVIEEIRGLILKRVNAVDQSELRMVTLKLTSWFVELKEFLSSRANAEYKELIYNPSLGSPRQPFQWDVLYSMRNVDESARIKVGVINGQEIWDEDKSWNEIRKNQLIVPFGPGAIVELENSKSALVSRWHGKGDPVSDMPDERFIQRLSRLRVKELVAPPSAKQKPIGAVLFPAWGFCKSCRKFGEIKNTFKFDARNGKERWSCECSGRSKLSDAKKFMNAVVQIKFIAVCSDGHIDDLPWGELLHKSPSYMNDGALHQFKYESFGGSLGEESLSCSCGIAPFRLNQLKKAITGQLCKNRPLTDYSTQEGVCPRNIEMKHRGASSTYFPVVRTSIYLPPQDDAGLNKVLVRLRNTLEDAGGTIPEDQKRIIVENNLIQIGVVKEIAWPTYLRFIEPVDIAQATNVDEEIKYREEEYKVFSAPAVNQQVFLKDLVLDEVSPSVLRSKKYPEEISDMKLIKTLKETRAILGYTRIYPIDFEEGEGAEGRRAGMISLIKNYKIPAIEVRGEGIFFRLNPSMISDWAKKSNVVKRVRIINEHERLSGRQYGVGVKNVTPAFILIHTLAHALIRYLGMECGYGTASLRERIYCHQVEGDIRMAGVMIYTASGDAAGTLGGLVRQGREDRFPTLYRNAIHSMDWCSSDPLCIQSKGQGRDGLNVSACHACALLPETSCEFQNVYLDRALLNGTIDDPKIGFFKRYE